jgi:predicted amidohydrolase
MNLLLGKKKRNLERSLSFLEEAKKQGANIICFPEFFTTSYKLTLNQYQALAETIPGETTDRIRSLSKGLTIIGGIVEKDDRIKGLLYDSAFIVENSKLIGKYRKTHLYPTEHQFFRAGKELPVFSSIFGKIAIAICFDHAFPEIFRIYALKGAELVFIPTAVPKGYEHLLELRTRARAQDNQIFVASANGCGKEKDKQYCGGSLVVDPKGRIIARGGEQEEIVYANIELEDIEKERILEPVFRSRRSELYMPYNTKNFEEEVLKER